MPSFLSRKRKPRPPRPDKSKFEISFDPLFAVFCGGDAEVVFEITVERAERGISHLESAPKDRLIGIIKQVAGFIQSEDVEVGDVGNTRRLFEAS